MASLIIKRCSSSRNAWRSVEKKPKKRESKFSCPFCFTSFSSSSALISHKDSEHFRRKPYKCNDCDETFSSAQKRIIHLRKAHGVGSRKKSNDNDSPSPTNVLKDDEDMYHDDQESEFLSSGLFRNPSFLAKHICNCVKQAVSPDPVISKEKIMCLKCSESFHSSEELLFHLSTKKHGNADNLIREPENIPITCSECQRTFQGELWNKIHAKYHHPKTFTEMGDNFSLKCKFCSKEFHEAKVRTMHELLFCSSNAILCSKCDCKFKSVSEYATHLKNHTSAPRPFRVRCPICKLSRPRIPEPHLQDHFRTLHSDITRNSSWNFTCKKCDFKSDSSIELLEHMHSDTHPEFKKPNAKLTLKAAIVPKT